MLNLKKNKGFSIVELLVSIGIGLFIMGGLGSVLLTSRDMFTNEQESSFIQENARYAIEILKRDIRLAGNGGCTNLDFWGNSVALGNSVDGDLDNLLDTQAIMGYEIDAGAGTFPSSIQSEVAGSQGDAIILRYADPSTAVNVESHDPVATSITTSDPHGFTGGEILMIADANCRHVGLFQLSSAAPPADTILHDTSNAVQPGNCSTVIKAQTPASSYDCSLCTSFVCNGNAASDFGEGSQVMSFSAHIYYIADSTVLPGVPALKRRVLSGSASSGSRREELAQGVESLNFTYGSDTDADGVVDILQEADDVADWSQVLTVRYEMIIRSLANVLVEDDPVTGDRFLRHTVTGMSRIRNR